jgi:uncharacterized protein (TIGR02996 family)
MNEEQALLAAYARNYPDEAQRLVLADWFDERGDLRGAWLRDPVLAEWMGPQAEDPTPKLVAALATDARDRAAEVLRKLGAAALPGLLDAWLNGPAKVQGRARAILGEVAPPPATLPKLVERLQADDPRTQLQAIRAIGDLEVAGIHALPHLLNLLHEDRDALRRAVIEALAKFGPCVAVALRAAWGELVSHDSTGAGALFDAVARLGPQSDAVTVLTDALGSHIGESAANHLEKLGLPVAGAVLASFATAHSDSHAAVAGVLHSLGVGVLPVLMEAANDPLRDGEVRRGALQALGDFGECQDAGDETPRIVASLLGLLNEGDALFSEAVLECLERFGPAAAPAMPALLRLLQGGPESLQGFVLRVLLAIGPEAAAALPLVRPLVGHPHQWVRAAAVRFVQEFAGAAEAADELRLALDSKKPAVRAQAAQSLAEFALAMPDAVPLLRRALADPNKAVRQAAADTLWRVPWPENAELTEPFRTALKDRSRTVRQRALEALARRGKVDALVPDLLHLAQKDGNTEVRRVAIEVLGQCGVRTPEVLAALRAAVRARDQFLRRTALRVLRGWTPVPAEIVPDLLGWLGHRNPEVMAAAAEMLGGLADPPPEAAAALRNLLHKNTRFGNAPAAEALVKLNYAPTPADLPRLLQAAQEQNTQAAFAAASLLSRLGPSAVPGLVALLGAGTDQVQRCAAHALGGIGTAAADVLPALAERLGSPDPHTRGAVVEAIGKVGSAADVVPHLRRALRDRHSLVRSSALRACARMGAAALPLLPGLLELVRTEEDYSMGGSLRKVLVALAGHSPDVVAGLREALHDPEAGACCRACLALAETGANAAPAVPDLVELLDHPAEGVRRTATYALGRCGAAAVRALPRLRDWARRTNPLQQSAIDALGELGPLASEAVPDLLRGLAAAEPWVRARAVQALGKMGAAARSAVPHLRPLLEDPDESVRKAAEQALAATAPAGE